MYGFSDKYIISADCMLQGAVSKNDLQTANRLLSTIKVSPCLAPAEIQLVGVLALRSAQALLCYAAQADTASCTPSPAREDTHSPERALAGT